MRNAWKLALICLAIGFGSLGQAQTSSGSAKAAVVTGHAAGTFEVKMTPLGPDDKIEGVSLGRMSIDKQYRGDMEGSGKGEMLAALTAVKDSAGYVAMERVSGTLQGRRGTFLLQHTGTMTGGAQNLMVTVVPDSGTGQLAGLSGQMKIDIVEGKHLYEFDYAFAGSR
jgi:hypothetical protein